MGPAEDGLLRLPLRWLILGLNEQPAHAKPLGRQAAIGGSDRRETNEWASAQASRMQESSRDAVNVTEGLCESNETKITGEGSSSSPGARGQGEISGVHVACLRRRCEEKAVRTFEFGESRLFLAALHLLPLLLLPEHHALREVPLLILHTPSARRPFGAVGGRQRRDARVERALGVALLPQRQVIAPHRRGPVTNMPCGVRATGARASGKGVRKTMVNDRQIAN